MAYMAKSALRSTKNYVKGYSDIQIKVREATSNDAWGASGTLMAEIAEATFDPSRFIEIMEMLDKRLNDHGKNWRHVFKSLTLLDYLLHCGSENVINYARDNLYVVKTLKEFQYIDEEGKDQGANVRQKSKEITSLLSDEQRLREERRARLDMRSRLGNARFDEYSSTAYSPSTLGYNSSSGGGGGLNSPTYQTDDELQKALDESRRTAQEEERKRRERERSEEDLRRAIELSKKEAEKQKPNEVDLLDIGSSSSGGNQMFNNNDPFAIQGQPRPVPSFDPFAPTSNAGFGGNGGFGGAPNPFQQQQQQQQQQFGGINPFGGPASAPPGMYGNNPNAMVADIARNSGRIDPFASLAGGSSNNGNPNPFGASSQQQSAAALDPFGSIAGPNDTSPPLFAQSSSTPAPASAPVSSQPATTFSNLPSTLVNLNPSSLTSGSLHTQRSNTSAFSSLISSENSSFKTTTSNTNNPFAAAASMEKKPTLNELKGPSSSGGSPSMGMQPRMGAGVGQSFGGGPIGGQGYPPQMNGMGMGMGMGSPSMGMAMTNSPPMGMAMSNPNMPMQGQMPMNMGMQQGVARPPAGSFF